MALLPGDCSLTGVQLGKKPTADPVLEMQIIKRSCNGI